LYRVTIELDDNVSQRELINRYIKEILYGLKEETDEILRQIDKEEELQQIINEVNNIFGFGSGKRGEFRKYKKS